MNPTELNEERVRQIVREELAALITQPFVNVIIDMMSNILLLGIGGDTDNAGTTLS